MSKWLPIPRASSTIPWGYKLNPENSEELLPIEEELELLEKAKKYIHFYTIRDVADWLSKQSGRKISYEGLRRRINSDLKRSRRKAGFVQYERLQKEALEAEKKANAAERKLGGNKIDYSEGIRRFRDAARDPETGRVRRAEGSEDNLPAESGATD